MIDAKIRGSKQMRWKCPKLSIEKNPYVIIEYNEDLYKFGTILWVYQEWEYRELIKRGYIFDFDSDKTTVAAADDLFDYDHVKQKKKVVVKKSYKDTRVIFTQQLIKKLKIMMIMFVMNMKRRN